MKKSTTIAAIFLLMISFPAKSQDAAPKGYIKGSITLSDNTELTGFIKDDIRNKAAIVLIASGGKKVTYDGDKLNRVSFETAKYICIKGDFFKILCEGELCFLQKSSDASSKPVYVGSEAMFINGTEGKPGDYFIYNRNKQQLKLVNNKNVTEVTAQSFMNCEAAIAKAKEATTDISVLQDAVVIFNNRNK
jgi:hypothetical protein